MPYVKQYIRDAFNEDPHWRPSDAGSLNFVLTNAYLNDLSRKEIYRILEHYWLHDSDFDQSYQTINDIMGAVGGSLFEFIRRRPREQKKHDRLTDMMRDLLWDFYEEYAVPYEDKKINANGDVYPKEKK